MQLTQFTDYSLRTLIYITVKQDTCKITEIAESYRISRHHLVKVVHKLGQLGYLKTVRGKNGGVRLNHPPEEINLAALVVKIEPHFHLVECFDRATDRCCITPVCKLKHVLWQAKEAFVEVLAQYTLADMVSNKDQLAAALGMAR